jgi:hypothetical protein
MWNQRVIKTTAKTVLLLQRTEIQYVFSLSMSNSSLKYSLFLFPFIHFLTVKAAKLSPNRLWRPVALSLRLTQPLAEMSTKNRNKKYFWKQKASGARGS